MQHGITINKGRGATPEEIAHRASKKVINIADSMEVPDSVKDEARAFQKKIENLMLTVARETEHNTKATIYNMIKDAGHPELAQLILRK